MAAKKRRGNTEAVTPGVDMLEETTSVLLTVGDSLPETKSLLSTKVNNILIYNIVSH